VEELAAPQTMSTSAASTALSKDRKKRGWSFVGPTTVHAFMRAMGLINDHGGMCRPATGRSREDDFHTTCIAKKETERPPFTRYHHR